MAAAQGSKTVLEIRPLLVLEDLFKGIRQRVPFRIQPSLDGSLLGRSRVLAMAGDGNLWGTVHLQSLRRSTRPSVRAPRDRQSHLQLCEVLTAQQMPTTCW